jgi:hypothetical protein
MQINSTTSSYAAQALTQAPSATQASQPASNPYASTTNASSSGSVSTYDFTSMTPNQMKSAVQSLAGSGQITSSQAIQMQLAGMPLGTDVNGQFEPLTAAQQQAAANTPVNYMQLFQNNMSALQPGSSGYDDDQSILAAMSSAQGGVSSVDVTA